MAIKYFNLSPQNDATLIAKLNAVAKHEDRTPHGLGKLLLEKRLDEIIAKEGIQIETKAQPTDLVPVAERTAGAVLVEDASPA
ncbi:MAG: hypothetical protein LLF76_02350 [Planctomycetaceae bacterium]|nr:hypothetical protein [Planctomycetaceae bacterium]